MQWDQEHPALSRTSMRFLSIAASSTQTPILPRSNKQQPTRKKKKKERKKERKKSTLVFLFALIDFFHWIDGFSKTNKQSKKRIDDKQPKKPTRPSAHFYAPTARSRKALAQGVAGPSPRIPPANASQTPFSESRPLAKAIITKENSLSRCRTDFAKVSFQKPLE